MMAEPSTLSIIVGHFADLAVGLMKGAFDHWNETVEMVREDKVVDGNQVSLFVN